MNVRAFYISYGLAWIQGVRLTHLGHSLHRLDLIGNTSTSAVHALLASASNHDQTNANCAGINNGNMNNSNADKERPLDWGRALAKMRDASTLHLANVPDPRDTVRTKGREYAAAPTSVRPYS